MPWPRQCAVCHSFDVQFTLDELFCLICGRLTDANGVPVPLEIQYDKESK